MMSSAWAQRLDELLLRRKLRDSQPGFAFAFELHHNSGDGLIIENGQEHSSGDEFQVRKVSMRSIKLNVHRHGSLGSGEEKGVCMYACYVG